MVLISKISKSDRLKPAFLDVAFKNRREKQQNTEEAKLRRYLQNFMSKTQHAKFTEHVVISLCP